MKPSYKDIVNTPLRWYRLTEIVLFPLYMLLSALFSVYLFSVLTGIGVSQITFLQKPLLTTTYPVVSWGILGLNLIFIYITLQAWIRNFKWMKSAYVYRIVRYVLMIIALAGITYLFYEKEMYVVAGLDLKQNWDIEIRAAVILIVFVCMNALLMVYCAACLLYTIKRRGLYHRMEPVKEEIVPDEKEPEEIVPSVKKVRFCSECGTEIKKENMLFCPQCGHKLN